MNFLKLKTLFLLSLWTICATYGQGYNLVVGGGSFDNDCDLTDQHWSDETLQWFVDRIHLSGPNGGNGRILIIDYESYPQCNQNSPGSFVGECAYFRCLGAVEADHVCVTQSGGGGRTNCLKADSDEAYNLILQYDGLWFRGGDQAKYATNWKNTKTESAIFEVWSAGGVVGGTSAGAMIQSEVVSTGDAPSWEATGDPFQSSIQLTTDFFAGPHTMLSGAIVDSHFFGRARLGRLSVFLARLKQATGDSYLGIGVDSETALAIYPDGSSRVLGEGSVTFLFPTEETELQLAPQKPPYISNLQTHVLTEGFRFDVTNRVVLSVPDWAQPSGPFPADTASQPAIIEGAVETDRMKASRYILNPTTQNALWHGNLVLADGTPGIDNALVTTNLEANSAFRENRAGGPLWGLKEDASQGLALFTDGFSGSSCNGVQVAVDGNLVASSGKGCPKEQSLLVVDCCGLEWVDQSSWDSDGDGNNRQSVALTPCRTTLWNSQLGPSAYRPRCLSQVPCLPAGSTCLVDEDCCSGTCSGRVGNKKCQTSGGGGGRN